MAERKKALRGTNPATKQGRKYGKSEKKVSLANVAGHRSAGWDNMPPITGPSVFPEAHINAMNEKALK